jgi:hypothetical protein
MVVEKSISKDLVGIDKTPFDENDVSVLLSAATASNPTSKPRNKAAKKMKRSPKRASVMIFGKENSDAK